MLARSSELITALEAWSLLVLQEMSSTEWQSPARELSLGFVPGRNHELCFQIWLRSNFLHKIIDPGSNWPDGLTVTCFFNPTFFTVLGPSSKPLSGSEIALATEVNSKLSIIAKIYSVCKWPAISTLPQLHGKLTVRNESCF